MKFYRDVLDGPIYIVAVVLAVILIMAIIGFIMERKQYAKAAANKVAHVDQNVAPIEEVKVEKKQAPKKEKKVRAKAVAKEAAAKEVSVSTELPVFESAESKDIKVEDKK